MRRRLRMCAVGLVAVARVTAADAQSLSTPFGAGQARVLATLHGEGAQLYECRVDPTGAAAWRFREPRADLFLDGRIVGRHYGGPTWEARDGAAIVGRIVAQTPGSTARDVALLKLEVVERRGSGALTAATVVQRLNTRGGAFAGSCAEPGAIHSEPYSADYIFTAPAMGAEGSGPR